VTVFSAGNPTFYSLNVVIQEVTTELSLSWCYVRAGSKRCCCKLARRAAAAYGEGCEWICGPSHLIYLLLFAVQRLSSRLTWHDFAYVTMVFGDGARAANEQPQRIRAMLMGINKGINSHN